MATEPFLINPPRKRVLPRTLQAKKQSRKFIDGKSKARKVQSKRSRFTPNPLGEALMIVGANPTLRRTKMLENAWFGHPVEHRRAAVKGWRKRRTRSAAPARKRRSVKRRAVSAAPKRRRAVSRRSAAGTTRRRRRSTRRRTSPVLYTGATPFRYANNPRRRRRSRRALSSNPRRRGSRRMRRNPASLGLGGMVGSFRRALPLAVTGGASIIATNLAPSFAARYVGNSNLAKYGVQVATAVVGGIGVSKFVGREHGTVWTVSGLAVIVADLAQKYLLGRFLPSVAGFGEYEMGPSVYGVNAFPEAMNAYPEETVQGFGSAFGEASDPYGQTVGPY